MTERHPCTQGWVFPEQGRAALPAPLQRTNLRELAARPGRFEHHLVVVGQVGSVQLEIPTASEPLFFAHRNFSDEYVVALDTGDPMAAQFPFRVFIQDPETMETLTRINHRVNELVLHPYGYLHWPGQLRPPYDPPRFAPGIRRCGLTLVCCAADTTLPGAERPLWRGDGLEDRVKHYTAQQPPVLLADLTREQARTVAVCGDARWELLVQPPRIEAPRGGYFVVLDGGQSPSLFDCDLVYVPPAARLDTSGVARGLWLTSDVVQATPPPDSWREVIRGPMPPFEQGPPASLPVRVGELNVEALDDARVRVQLPGGHAEVPRHWLARLLFRVALHNYRLGYVETYGGFYYDDSAGEHRLGLRGQGHVEVSSTEIAGVLQTLYRAVAPPGYHEDLRP